MPGPEAVSVRVTGLTETIAGVRDVGVTLRDLREPLMEVQAALRPYAQKVTPVDTGRLQRSTGTARPRNKRVEVTWATWYAPFPLYGTRFQKQAATLSKVYRWLKIEGPRVLDNALQGIIKKAGIQ